MTMLVSPEGEIQFMSLNKKTNKNMTDGSPQGYVVKIKFDGNTKEGAAWRKELESINKGLIGVKHTDKAGEFTVRAFSLYDVLLLDNNAKEVEDKDQYNYFKGVKATGRMAVMPYTGNKLGGSLSLVAVTVTSWDASEADTTGATNSREDILASIRALMQ